MFPAFTNALLLLGLTALSIPIVIHLLLRRKSRRLRFSTIRFFVQMDEGSSKKRKLRNWLLLFARLSLFALIVLAFARPFVAGGSSDPQARKPRQVVLVVDVSASMTATIALEQQWDRAMALGRRLLSDLRPGDRAALIRCSTETEVVATFAPSTTTARQLDAMRPGAGTGNISEGIRKALELLGRSDPGFVSSIAILSDLQRSSCQNLAACAIPPDVDVQVPSSTEPSIPNFAVTGLRADSSSGPGPAVQVTGWGAVPRPELRTVLRVGGKELFAATHSLPADGTTDIPLPMLNLPPGWHSVEFEALSEDAFSIDDTRFQAVYIPEPTRVLAVEPRKPGKVFQEETFFLVTALDPSFGSSTTNSSKFVIQKVGLESWLGTLTNPDPALGVDVVLLPGLKQPLAEEAAALISTAKRGGRVVLFLGDAVSPNRYNHQFRDLLPARIGTLEITAENHPNWSLGDYDKEGRLFEAFRRPNSGDLRLAQFSRRFSLTPHDESSVLAWFDDGEPLVVERKLGLGSVLLVNTTSDTAWTDWPKHKTFVPWVHAVGSHSMGGATGRHLESSLSLESGSVVDIELGSTYKDQKFELLRQGSRISTLVSDARGKVRDVSFDSPGIYSVRAVPGLEVLRIAASLPVLESDLSSLTPLEFQRQLGRSTGPIHAASARGIFEHTGRTMEYWRLLLWGALILLLVEPLVANRMMA